MSQVAKDKIIELLSYVGKVSPEHLASIIYVNWKDSDLIIIEDLQDMLDQLEFEEAKRKR